MGGVRAMEKTLENGAGKLPAKYGGKNVAE